jgi:ABC-type dipeptide/oligopeptide/nickel transport system permease subunit
MDSPIEACGLISSIIAPSLLVSARAPGFVYSSCSMVSSRLADVRSGSYYRLGKNRFGSGILSRYSWSALNFHVMAVIITMTPLAMAVLALQFAG